MTTNGTTAGAMPEIAEHEPAIPSSKAKRLYLILGGAVVAPAHRLRHLRVSLGREGHYG